MSSMSSVKPKAKANSGLVNLVIALMVVIFGLLVFSTLAISISANNYTKVVQSIKGELPIILPDSDASVPADLDVRLDKLEAISKKLMSIKELSSVSDSSLLVMNNAAKQLNDDVIHLRAKRGSMDVYVKARAMDFAAIGALASIGATMPKDHPLQQESYVRAVEDLLDAASKLSPSSRDDFTSASARLKSIVGGMPLTLPSTRSAVEQLSIHGEQSLIVMKEMDRYFLAKTMLQSIRDDATLLSAKRSALEATYSGGLTDSMGIGFGTTLSLSLALLFGVILLAGLLGLIPSILPNSTSIIGRKKKANAQSEADVIVTQELSVASVVPPPVVEQTPEQYHKQTMSKLDALSQFAKKIEAISITTSSIRDKFNRSAAESVSDVNGQVGAPIKDKILWLTSEVERLCSIAAESDEVSHELIEIDKKLMSEFSGSEVTRHIPDCTNQIYINVSEVSDSLNESWRIISAACESIQRLNDAIAERNFNQAAAIRLLSMKVRNSFSDNR